MGKLKFIILNEKQVSVVKDSLRVYVAIRTEEYQKNPSLRKSKIMEDAIEALDIFIRPPTPTQRSERRAPISS